MVFAVRATLVFFSPTGTTRRVLDAVAAGAGDRTPFHIDMTLPPARASPVLPAGGVPILGAPVHEGRVPPLARAAFDALPPSTGPCAVVTVFGNKMAGIALGQLQAMASAKGYTVVGAGSFIGEHSFSTGEMPVAAGRPDDRDLDVARRFGEVLATVVASTPVAPLDPVPGRLPGLVRLLPEGAIGRAVRPPRRDGGACTACGACAAACPAGAIDPATLDVDARACIRCMACARACLAGARRVPGSRVLRSFFKDAAGKRMEPRWSVSRSPGGQARDI